MSKEHPKLKADKSPPETRGFASPPCSMHELDADSFGLGEKPLCGEELAIWRKAQRKRLIAERLTISRQTRITFAKRIAVSLERLIKDPAGQICSFYWPFRGEPDLSPLMERFHQRGGTCALPCVVGRNKPLVFRVWEPDAKMEQGVWSIIGSDMAAVTLIEHSQPCRSSHRSSVSAMHKQKQPPSTRRNTTFRWMPSQPNGAAFESRRWSKIDPVDIVTSQNLTNQVKVWEWPFS